MRQKDATMGISMKIATASLTKDAHVMREIRNLAILGNLLKQKE
jgi:hypothetical protein